jgi:hypothetical protein
MSNSVPKVEEPVQKPVEQVKPVEPEQVKPHFLKRMCTSVVSTVGWHLYYIFGFMAPEMNFIGHPEGTDYWRLSRCEKNWLIYLFCLRTLVWTGPAIVLICIALPFSLLAFMWG